MYSIKAKSISNIIPNNVVDKYPYFVDFLEKYYEWQTKTTLEMSNVMGNMDIACCFFGTSSEFTVNKDVNNRPNESYTVEFDEHRTFVEGERIVASRKFDDPIRVSLNDDNEYLLDEESAELGVSLYRGQTYKFQNLTGKPLYVKTRRIIGSGDLFTDITNNGSESSDDILQISITEDTPRLLYFTVGEIETIGIFTVSSVPAIFQNTVNAFDPTVDVITGFGVVESILFNPEYLFENFDKLQTVDAPDAFFYRFLGNYGLEDLFANNYQLRKPVYDFLRFFQKKGTEDAIKFFFRNFFDKDVSITYPGELVLKPSDAEYFIRDQMFVDAKDGIELSRNRRVLGTRSGTIAVIEALVFDAVDGVYKLYLDEKKTSGHFLINEPINSIDDNNDQVLYDVRGNVIGTVSGFEVVEDGNEYSVGQTISNSYTLSGESKLINFVITDVKSSVIRRYEIGAAGTGYAVADTIFFPKPTKKTVFYAVVTETTTSHNFTINLEPFYGPTPNFLGAKLSINGIEYTADSFNVSTNTLQLNTDTFAPTVKAGNILNIYFPEDNVTDPRFDSSYFHPNTNVIKSQAHGYVSQVGAAGEIEELVFVDNGSGYIKRPSTTDGSIFIETTSGTGANISVIGQGFGGIKQIESNSDIVGVNFDTIVTVNKDTTPTADDARVRLLVDSVSKYGKFFANNKGFLSDQMYLHDSYYYQDFSYVIQSDLNFSDFASLFRKLAHPAGMIFFNQFFIINTFRQKLNKGSNVANAIKTIRIEKTAAYTDFDLNLIADITTLTKFLFTIQEKTLQDEFRWRSESVLTLDDTWDTTGSGVTIGSWSNTTLEHNELIPRSLNENWIDHYRTVELQSTITASGTISYSDTESGLYSDFITVSGTNTDFYNQVGILDIINVSGEQLLVDYVNSPTELVAQRLDTASGIVVSGETYQVTQRLNTELGYSNFSTLNELNSSLTSTTTTEQIKNGDYIFVNI